MTGGGDWLDNLSETVEFDFAGEGAMDEIYDMIRLAGFLGGLYFVLVGAWGIVTACCKTACCGFINFFITSGGILLSFVLAIVLLAFSGLTDEIIEEICVDNYESLPYGVGDYLTQEEFSFKDLDDVLTAPT